MLVKKENVVDIYNLIAKRYSKTFSKPTSYIEDFLKLLPARGKILDLGCGVGVDSGFAASKGFIVTGIDLSKGMLKIAKSKYTNVDFHLGDMRKIKFPNGYFDGIIASFSLIHITKKELPEIIEKINKLLKSNGLLYIALQAGKTREIFINEPFYHNKKLFLNVISSREIKKLLKENGFEVIKKFERESNEDEINFIKLFIFAQKKPD
jgi:ubiquinone/menaquinone biosynthesis C-methylase UbiE